MPHVDFAQQGMADWHTVAGQWRDAERHGAPSGLRVQRAVEHDCSVIVVPSAP